MHSTEEHKDSSDLLDSSIRDLEYHMVGLRSRMKETLKNLCKAEDIAVSSAPTAGQLQCVLQYA